MVKDIYEFALKYYDLYTEPDTLEYELIDDFEDECKELGLNSNAEKEFITKYSIDAFYNAKALKKIIEEINDINLLASTIYSHWKYVRDWTNHSFLNEEIGWFQIAFERLEKLVKEDGHLLKGTLEKIQLETNLLTMMVPEVGEEIRQYLTINSKGQVQLSRYAYLGQDNNDKLIEDIHFEISKENINNIFTKFTDIFSEEYYIPYLTDVGYWDLTLTNTEGKDFNMSGPLLNYTLSHIEELSHVLRHHLNRDDVFAFDGNPDNLSKIDIKYRSITEIPTGKILSDQSFEYIECDNYEHLIIDGSTETLTYERFIGDRCNIKNIYCIQEGIKNLINNLDWNLFTKIEGNPDDILIDSPDKKDYHITLYYKRGKMKEISGSFDKKGLPTDWSFFINHVNEFMSFYGLGELFDKSIYNKPIRRDSDYIICHVQFEQYGKTYAYLADTDDYEEGDFVIVPVGPDNREAVVMIDSIDYCQKEDAPYPIDKMKHIIGIYDEYRS